MAREIELDFSSRLNATPLIQDEGTNDYYWGVWGEIEFPPGSDDKSYIIKEGDIVNWAGLADDFYGDFKKMWVIWAANGITDPWAVTPGIKIRIPSADVVDDVLANITKDAE